MDISNTGFEGVYGALARALEIRNEKILLEIYVG
jgi:hypothetical protein